MFRTPLRFRSFIAIPAAVAVAVVGLAGVVAAPANALGPNAVRPGFDTTTFAGNDDGSITVALPFTVNYFGTNYSSLFLNNNGNVTFDSALPTFTPFNLFTTARVIIAPFFADVDTRVGNPTRYGSGTVGGRPAWGATWPLVGCYNTNQSQLNSFQLIIIDRSDVGVGDFDIEFNYDQIHWDSGQASGGNANCQNGNAARAGYSNGTAANSFEIAGSGAAGGLLDSNPTTGLVNHSQNSAQLGRYVFAVRAGVPVAPTSVATSLVSDSASGQNIVVLPSTAVHDTATLNGPNATQASGTVTYSVYSDGDCESLVQTAGSVDVVEGNVGDSDDVTLSMPGTYYWRAFYSGDALNEASASECGDEVERVSSEDAINLTTTWSPSAAEDPSTGQVNSGSEALWTVNAANDNLAQVVDNAVVRFSISTGVFDLNAMKALNGSICAKSAANVGSAIRIVDCNVGDIAVGADATVKAVVNTFGVNPTTITATASATSTDGSSGSVGSSLIVDPASNDTRTAYIPPGGTISVGTKTPTAADPIYGVVTLPKKQYTLPPAGFGAAATPKPKLVPGPGVIVSLTVSPAATAGNACDGQPCEGEVIRILNPDCSGPPSTCPAPFEGYNDPAHPVLLNMTWFGGTFANTTLYIIKGDPPNEVGTAIGPCKKVKGKYQVIPCLAKRKVVKKTGQITDTVALLFGDPGGARRG